MTVPPAGLSRSNYVPSAALAADFDRFLRDAIIEPSCAPAIRLARFVVVKEPLALVSPVRWADHYDLVAAVQGRRYVGMTQSTPRGQWHSADPLPTSIVAPNASLA